MVGGILVGHAQFANGLYSALCAIIGEPEEFRAIATEGLGRADIERVVQEERTALGGQPLVVFTDLAGGSCTMVCGGLTRECRDVGLLCGVNLPMLVKFVQYRERVPFAELLRLLEDAGREGIRNLNPAG
jgi:mannose/fructose-specific phosphotransferase system component IIA